MKRIRHIIGEQELFYEEFHIQKKHGKTRRICAPSPSLKAAQRRLMESLYEKFQEESSNLGVTNCFHGFLPNRNIVTGAISHIGYKTTILMDITNCFDSIQYTGENKDIVTHVDGSLAQGFVTSPILANIYLIPVVSQIKQHLTELEIDHVITVYADDIIISTNEENYNYINLIPRIVKEILNEHRLEMNPVKTRIRHSKFGRRRILGIMVGETDITPSRRLKGKIRAARHQKNGPSLGGLVTASKNYLPKAIRESLHTFED